MVTRDPYEDKPPRNPRKPLTPEQKERYKARKQALAESEGYRSPYERRIARGLGAGRSRTEARGHSGELWNKAVARGPTRVDAEGREDERDPKSKRWRAIDYIFTYPDGSTTTVTFRGRAIRRQARKDRIEDLGAQGIPYFADYLDAQLDQQDELDEEFEE